MRRLLANIEEDLRGLAAPLLTLLIPAAFVVAEMALQYGWLSLTFGPSAILFWPTFVFWVLTAIISIRKRVWWALLTAPLALYPVILSVALLAACLQGNCL